ncbi:hypothetical protein LINPERHAP1_LOCUS20034 [Linum perenne]
MAELITAMAKLKSTVNGDTSKTATAIQNIIDLEKKLSTVININEFQREVPCQAPKKMKKRTETYKPKKRPVSQRDRNAFLHSVRKDKNVIFRNHEMGGNDLRL